MISKAVYKMEMRRHLKSFLVWAGSVGGAIFFGMLFYPAIGGGDFLDQLGPLFENPMMKGAMTAFGADILSMGSLTGFYMTYNSLFIILLGCLYASLLAEKLLAREEADRTAEFLYTKPLGRRDIFLSKTAVLFSYVILFGFSLFLVSFISFEAVKGAAPEQIDLSPGDKERIMESVRSRPGRIYEAFGLDDESFDRISLGFASGLLSESREVTEELDFDPGAMAGLLEEASRGPEEFFKGVLEQPGPYMALFGFGPERREEFLKTVKDEREEYRSMKRDFFDSPELFLMFFEADPLPFLDPFLTEPGSYRKAADLLEWPSSMEGRLLGKYSIRVLAILCAYVTLLILSLGSLVHCLSLLMKRGQSILGLSLGIIFFFYFLDSLGSAAGAFSPLVDSLRWISPFSWIDGDFGRAGFSLEGWRILLFLFMIIASLFSAELVFRKKNIIL